MVMLGDSNQLFAGFGWDAGMIRALNNEFGIYATGVHWCGEGAGIGRGTGEGFFTISPGGISSGFAFSGAPPQLDIFGRLSNSNAGADYLYLQSGSLPGGRQVGMGVNGVLDTKASLRYWLTDGTFPTQGALAEPWGAAQGIFQGSYTPMARIGQPPWSTIAIFGAVSTRNSGESFALRTQSYTIAADTARTQPIDFRFAPTWFTPGFQSPFFALWQRVEEVSSNGSSAHTLYAVGGRSARFMSTTMNGASDAMLEAFFEQVRSLLPEPKRVLVRIHQGLNDRNEVLPSIRLGILPGNSPEAYVDNIAATIARIRAIYTSKQWSEQGLAFVIVTPFNVNSPQDLQLASYRDAAAALLAEYPRLAVVDQAGLIPYATMVSQGYFANSVDRNHLSNAGYVALASAELAALVAAGTLPTCIGDFNNDGGITGDDIAAFFTAYECGAASSDVNQDGGVTGDDIAAFFTAYQAGC